VRSSAAAVALAVLAALPGCAQEGAGTIKLEPGARQRGEMPGAAADEKKVTAKQAKAKELESEAARKNPKLQ
jgi:hypothetical protein